MKRIPYKDLELGQVLGTGTVGTVYRARVSRASDAAKGMPEGDVAVKVLQEAISSDALVRKRFRREMDILDRLTHPHIIRYLGGGEHEGKLYYAMELVDGGTVADVLTRYGTLTWQEAASVGRQVCSALQHAHNFGIVHRDVKPSNLFLDSDACVKLGDFGIARDNNAPDITTQGLTVGTHAYMSPEQITASEFLSEKADLYSLGCVLFELLTGRKLFDAPNFAALFEQHLRKQPPRVSDFVEDCPQPMVDLVDGLLQKDPAKRPFNARTVQGVLQELLVSEGVNADGVPALKVGRTVGAANTSGFDDASDPGVASLVQKLTLPPAHEVSWVTLGIIACVALLLIFLASVAV